MALRVITASQRQRRDAGKRKDEDEEQQQHQQQHRERGRGGPEERRKREQVQKQQGRAAAPLEESGRKPAFWDSELYGTPTGRELRAAAGARAPRVD